MPLKLGSTNISDLYFGSLPIEKVYKGTELVYQKLLPRGYVECEYLESTGTQYIDTDIVPTVNTTSEMVWSITQFDSAVRCRLFGESSNNSYQYNAHCYGARWNSQNNLVIGLGTRAEAQQYQYGAVNLGEKYTLIVDGPTDTIKVNNTTHTYSHTALSTNLSLHIFNINGLSLPLTGNGTIRCYSCKIWENGTLVRNFIPCLDNNGVPCMYDIISKQTFYNAGSGTFNYG